MSRIGKKPILIPENVEVKIEGQRLMVKGPKGELVKEIPPEIKVEIKESDQKERFSLRQIQFFPKINLQKEKGQAKKIKALWGLSRALAENMIKGVTSGYEKKLEIEGLGYKVLLEGEDLVLYVGFSHPVKIKAPPGIKFSVEKNVITVSGIDKELVTQMAAKIKKVKPAEPYKGKGIKYQGEIIRRKAGKKAAATQG